MIYLIEEDFPSNIYIYFLRYYIGTNYHLDQYSLIYDIGINSWKSLIPYKVDPKYEEIKKSENLDVFVFNKFPLLSK